MSFSAILLSHQFLFPLHKLHHGCLLLWESENYHRSLLQSCKPDIFVVILPMFLFILLFDRELVVATDPHTVTIREIIIAGAGHAPVIVGQSAITLPQPRPEVVTGRGLIGTMIIRNKGEASIVKFHPTGTYSRLEKPEFSLLE